MHSARINRAEGGSFAINVGPSLASGNWLEITGEGNFILVFNFYDSSIFSVADMQGNTLPAIIEERCDV